MLNTESFIFVQSGCHNYYRLSCFCPSNWSEVMTLRTHYVIHFPFQSSHPVAFACFPAWSRHIPTWHAMLDIKKAVISRGRDFYEVVMNIQRDLPAQKSIEKCKMKEQIYTGRVIWLANWLTIANISICLLLAVEHLFTFLSSILVSKDPSFFCAR